jgi:hypothetical protein
VTAPALPRRGNGGPRRYHRRMLTHFFTAMLVIDSVAITVFALYVVFRLVTDES